MVGKPRCKKKADRLIQKARAFPNQRYHVLYADPPWRYHAQLTEGRKVGNPCPQSGQVVPRDLRRDRRQPLARHRMAPTARCRLASDRNRVLPPRPLWP
jgi:hypothetical protein